MQAHMLKKENTEMRRIIDSHAHLGDIFHENRNICFKTNIKKGNYEDRFAELEESLFTKPLFTGDLPRGHKDLQLVIDSGQFRCWEATLENTTRQLNENQLAGIVMLPVLPNTSFEEYLAASKLDPRIIPFTAADMDLPIDQMQAKLRRDIGRGAKGLKLHPILQDVRLLDNRMHAAADVFAEVDLPVVIHVGEEIYYAEDEPYPRDASKGSMKDFVEFAKMRKQYNQVLVAAHCAAHAKDLMEGCKGLDTIYADTSFCSVAAARESIKYMGPNRVMFGTDYPFINLKFGIEVIEKAFENDPVTKDKVLYANIARILHL
jgi:predicted TIM-barrel fold metal-dependent hydrolase